jgi:hypothetical protein
VAAACSDISNSVATIHRTFSEVKKDDDELHPQEAALRSLRSLFAAKRADVFVAPV